MLYSMIMKKLPLAITTFADIRDPNENYLYIDKTAFAYRLIDSGRYYFLSRPRRFGKSLFLDTLSDLLQSKKELFKGLAVYDKWNWDTSYPVMNISLNSGNFSSRESLTKSILHTLKNVQRDLKIECDPQSELSDCFDDLIKNAYDKYQQKVVILIDEYDKPILDNIENREQALVARDILKSFYSVIKDNDRYIKFVFITGVSKFSKMNLFSGLNNLTDITIMSDYADICGYTQNDIESHFAEHLVDVDLAKLKEWYNGYNYLGGEDKRVYNPFDILLFITNGCKYKNYWWSTGNPSFLIKKLAQEDYYIPDLENIVASEEVLETFDVDNIDLVALLWQTGYLTFEEEITRRGKIFYKLKLPNREIQSSLNELFIQYLTRQTNEAIRHQDHLYDALTGDISDLEQALTALFASIPYNNYANKIIEKYEGYYSSVVYTYFMSLGYPTISEDPTNIGRIDLTIQLPNRTVIIEFKVDQPQQAMQGELPSGKRGHPGVEQIKEQKYYQKYQKPGANEIYIVGINFSSEDKNITEFEWERV